MNKLIAAVIVLSLALAAFWVIRPRELAGDRAAG
jgi:hypothetical protein